MAAGENGRPLVEQTLATLVERPFSRNEIKPYFANLTIGSGAVAAIVCHRSLVPGPAHRLLGGVARAATEHSELCQGDTLGAEALAMQTDSEQLLLAGVALAAQTWDDFARRPAGTPPGSTGSSATRSVPATGASSTSASGWTWPRTSPRSRPWATWARSPCRPRSPPRPRPGRCVRGDRVALFGIGSGLNCMMLALEW